MGTPPDPSLELDAQREAGREIPFLQLNDLEVRPDARSVLDALPATFPEFLARQNARTAGGKGRESAISAPAATQGPDGLYSTEKENCDEEAA